MSECIEQIEALETQRSELVGVPTRGTVGRTTLDLSDVGARIESELATWRVRLQAARSGDGIARRPRWGC